MTNSKLKFYARNESVFLKYFGDSQRYRALIQAGNWKKIEDIIEEARTETEEDFIKKSLEELNLKLKNDSNFSKA